LVDDHSRKPGYSSLSTHGRRAAGDIFLVQVSVDDQQKVFSEKGFLPLDNHIGRLPPTGYAKFYDTRLSMVAPFVLPRDWFNSADGKGLLSAMNASFPTYSFSVRKAAD
jgi:hypothetical protein